MTNTTEQTEDLLTSGAASTGTLERAEDLPREPISARETRLDSDAPPRDGVSSAVIWAIRLLSGVALVVSAYLAWASFTSSKVAGCGGDLFDCSHVLTSRWSNWFGVPVSAAAVAIHALTFVGLAICGRDAYLKRYRAGWSLVTFCGLSAGMAAVWFISLQVFVLHHLCIYCLVAHTCGLGVAAIALWKHPLDWKTTGQLSALSAAGVALLITTQALTPPPPTFEIEYHPVVDEPQEKIAPQNVGSDGEVFESPGGEVFEAPGGSVFEAPGVEVFEAPGVGMAAPVGGTYQTAGGPPLWLAVMLLFAVLAPTAGAQDGSSTETGATGADGAAATAPAPVPKPARRFVQISGSAKLDVRHWPLLGKPEAKYIFAEMYDYTCPHCRNTHQAVHGAFQRYGDDLAVVALPVPLNRACNGSINVTHAKHIEACEIARLAIAVWRVSPDQFHAYHDWLFESPQARTAAAARARAAQLIGDEALRTELATGVPGKFIASHVSLYQRAGAGVVPKLLFPNTTLVGEVGSTTTLTGTIERELGGK